MLSQMPLSDRSIRRRAKRFLLREPLHLFVPTLPAFEAIAGAEIRALGFQPSAQSGGVSFEGDLSSVYRANLGLRVGNRVLLRLGTFLAQSYPMLYNRARNVPWEAVLGRCQEIEVRVSFSNSRLRNKEHIEKVIRDAILRRLKQLDVSADTSHSHSLTIHARLRRDRCTLSLDTTGAHLHKRGYRTISARAPLRETTAAAVLLIANSATYDLVVDPFCGSGTFVIEANLIARNYPPGAHRPFAITNSPLHSEGKFLHQRRILLAAAGDTTQRVTGLDISPQAVAQGRKAALDAGVTTAHLEIADSTTLNFRALECGAERRLVVANLPYGHRLGSPQAARTLLDRFSRILSSTAVGWHFALITPEAMPLTHPKLSVTRKVNFNNGGIPAVVWFGEVK